MRQYHQCCGDDPILTVNHHNDYINGIKHFYGQQ